VWSPASSASRAPAASLAAHSRQLAPPNAGVRPSPGRAPACFERETPRLGSQTGCFGPHARSGRWRTLLFPARVPDVSDPMPRERRALALAVRELRARRGLTQEQVADAAGVSRGYLGELEQGRRRASFEGVVRVARGLNVELGELVETYEARLREGR
jgi:DNA-binding XRE family transcriptional regulator